MSGSGTISWGDGGSSAAQVSGTAMQLAVAGTHAYGDEGSYGGGVSGEYLCGAASHPFSASFTATVADAALSASGTSLGGTEGQAVAGVVATFSDAGHGAAGDFDAGVDWGDGSSSSGAVSASGSGFAVSGSHTYGSAGSYQVTVTIRDPGGASAVAHSTVEVAVPPPKASFTLPSGAVATGQALTFDGSSSRPPGAVIRGFTWTLNGAVVARCAGSTSQLRTRFLGPGSYLVGLDVGGGNGETTHAQAQLAVGGSGLPGGSGVTLLHGVRLVRSQQVFACEHGPGDPLVPIVPAGALPTPGASCQTEVQAGIFDATGCLTEYQDTIAIDHESYTSHTGKTYELAQLRIPQTLAGVPAAETTQLLWDLNSYYLVSCVTVRDCSQPQGAQSYYGQTPPPTPLRALLRARRLAGAAGPPTLKDPGAHVPNVALQTPCSQTPDPSQGTACLDAWVSTGPVTVDGVTYVPQHGAAIVVLPQFSLVLSSDAEIDVANLQAKPPGTVNYQLPPDGQPPAQDFPALDVSDLPSLLRSQPQARSEFGAVAGFPLAPSSGLHVSFGSAFDADVTFQVALPAPFGDGNGGPVTVTVHATMSNTQPFQVVDGYLGGPNGDGLGVDMGAVTLSDFGVCFRHRASSDPSLDPCPGVTGIAEDPSFGDDFWDASGRLGIAGFTLAFRPGQGQVPQGCTPIPLGIGFGGGGLAFAGADLQTPGIPVAPGVTFDQALAGFADHAGYDTLSGCGVFSVGGGLVQLDGSLFAAFAKGGGVYRFSGGELPGLQPPYPYIDDLAFGVGGAVSVKLPVLGSTQLADGYALYVDDPAAVFFGAAADFSIPFGSTFENPPDTGIALRAGIDGGIGLASGFPPPFFLQGQMGVVGRVAPFGTIFSGSVQGILSDDPSTGAGGIAVCGTATVALLGTGTAGFGYHWGDSPGDVLRNDVHFGGTCGDAWFTGFAVDVQPRRLAAPSAAPPELVRVPRGAQAVDLYLRSAGGAPDVTVTGPGGVRASTAGIPLDRGTTVDGILLSRAPALDETYVVLLHPVPGSYRISANAGSPPIAGVREVDALAPDVRARVVGTGPERRLVYSLTPHPGEVVTFVERSRQAERVLGSTTRAHGTISFGAPAGRDTRQIVAEVGVAGTPSTTAVVATYRPSPLRRLGRVAWVRVRRAGSTATLAFAAVPGARAYEVALRLADGARRLYRTSRRTLALDGIYLEVAGTVRVRAVGDRVYTASGPFAAARLAAQLLPRTRAKGGRA